MSTAGTASNRAAENRTEAIVSRLAEEILSGALPPGTALPPERGLAREMGVSRNALREATKILQSRGLVTIKHGMRTVVNGVTSEPMQRAVSGALYGRDNALLQLTEVRLMLEVSIAELAAQRVTPAAVAELGELATLLTENVGRPADYAEIDIAFHRAIARATGNDIFPILLDSISGLLRESMETSLHGGLVAQLMKAVAGSGQQRLGQAASLK
jgi:GntR family transcriptional repressor for pyruvate dehydrogenase complex